MKWQPIETAPDKGPILVVDTNADVPKAMVGYYIATEPYGGTSPGDWYVGHSASLRATHWMPLPEPPETELAHNAKYPNR